MQVAVRLRQSEKLGRVTVPPTVALLRYAYDSEAKRARQERVGTVPFWTGELPDDLKAQLTPEELADWQTFVNDRNHHSLLIIFPKTSYLAPASSHDLPAIKAIIS
jgi:hypothetical protein